MFLSEALRATEECSSPLTNWVPKDDPFRKKDHQIDGNETSPAAWDCGINKMTMRSKTNPHFLFPVLSGRGCQCCCSVLMTICGIGRRQPCLTRGADGPLIAQMSLRRRDAVEMMDDVSPAPLPSAIKRCLENNGKPLNQWRLSGSLKWN